MLTPEQRRLRAKIAATTRWARVLDRTAETDRWRDGRRKRFISMAREIDPAGTEAQTQQRADALWRAELLRMSLKSSQVRKSRKSR